MVKRVLLTKEQLSRVVGNIIKETTTTGSVSADPKLIKVKKGKSLAVSSYGQVDVGPTGVGPSTATGSPNQAAGSEGYNSPNTTGNSVAGLNDMFAPSFTDDIGYDDSVKTNVEYQQPTVFDGLNPTYLPGSSNDKGANLKMNNDFGFDGVSIDTTSGKYDVKIGKQFKKDMTKGKVHKKSKQKHAELNPNRHKNSSPITNVVHKDGINRGGVSFDSSFKPGKGGDPFTVKTS